MKLVDKHILGDICPGFVVSVVLFAGFIWIAAGPLLNAFNDLAKGIPVWIVLQLIGLYLPPMLVLAFPMGMLIAVILGFNRLSAESEAVALFASGISFYRMLAPLVGFAVLMTIVGLLIDNSVVPAANSRISYLKANVIHDVTATVEPFPLPPLRYSNGKIEALVWVEGGFDANTRQLKRVTIDQFDAKDGRPSALIYADSAQWLGGVDWQLQNGQFTYRNGVFYQFKTMVVRDISQKPDAIASLQESPDDLTFGQLARRIATLKAAGWSAATILREDEVSLWEKIALPCACFVFALVGAPLALRPQRGASRGVAAVWGVVIILAYYAVFKYLDILGSSGHINPALAAFLPNLLGLGLAGYLIAKAPT